MPYHHQAIKRASVRLLLFRFLCLSGVLNISKDGCFVYPAQPFAAPCSSIEIIRSRVSPTFTQDVFVRFFVSGGNAHPGLHAGDCSHFPSLGYAGVHSAAQTQGSTSAPAAARSVARPDQFAKLVNNDWQLSHDYSDPDGRAAQGNINSLASTTGRGLNSARGSGFHGLAGGPPSLGPESQSGINLRGYDHMVDLHPRPQAAGLGTQNRSYGVHNLSHGHPGSNRSAQRQFHDVGGAVPPGAMIPRSSYQASIGGSPLVAGAARAGEQGGSVRQGQEGSQRSFWSAYSRRVSSLVIAPALANQSLAILDTLSLMSGTYQFPACL